MESFYDTNKIYDVDELNLKLNSFIVLASKRQSGKSVLCKHIIQNLINKNDIKHILLFSKTATFNDDYTFIDKKYIYDYDKSESIIKKVMEHQKQKIKKAKDKTKIDNILMIFDDVTLSKKNFEIINLSTLGRHFKITVILSVQYPKGLFTSSIRGNINYVFFNDLNYEGEDAIYKTIHIPFKYNEFHNFIDNNNDDYKFIMYDNNEKNKKERIKIVKAKILDLQFV